MKPRPLATVRWVQPVMLPGCAMPETISYSNKVVSLTAHDHGIEIARVNATVVIVPWSNVKQADAA